ncbi:MAG: DUF2726 domain-containing protein [Phycisphaerae bacterium]|nr:DUF2726 domain-containing protein [Phycisphaerae bacterium]
MSIVLGALAGLSLALKVLLRPLRRIQAAVAYQKTSALFSAAEREFLEALDKVVGDQFRVFGKVRLADVIDVKANLPTGRYQAAFNSISAKHVDFVLCDPKTMAIQCVVELDDSTHGRPDRRERDAFLDDALRTAGMPIFHFRAQSSYSPDEIRKAIFLAQPPQRPAA